MKNPLFVKDGCYKGTICISDLSCITFNIDLMYEIGLTVHFFKGALHLCSSLFAKEACLAIVFKVNNVFWFYPDIHYYRKLENHRRKNTKSECFNSEGI